ncbi:MAG TPA: SDR family NAD(P)-dependent oxidoreductase [Methylomirabilota bacterium]|jgi:3-oxoacyl-[acyl-carrier protein] reductase|nr:SDR family NAD(P)-dependent oxidoreductase [Methylomirabilota bacterium]
MSEFLDLHGKVAVVTGAASGLGRAVARGLVREGARVVLGDIDKAGLERTARELGDAARWHRTDVARRDDVAALFRVCDEAFGPVEILATCAGIISSAPLAVMTEEEWDRVLAINTKGTFFCIQEAVTRMIPRRRGRIVTIGSDSVTRGGGRVATAAYTASKGAVVALTRNIARDLVGTGVSVNCLNPGPIDSPMHAPLTAEQRARVTASIPLGWMAKPEEIANGVLFLASDRAASFMFGANLNIDGGSQMGTS